MEFMVKKTGLVMGKQQKKLESTLDYGEKQQLRKAVAAEIRTYRQEVNDKYTDDFNSSIMVDAQDTKTKNEILRRIKYFKKKKNRLPDFIREERTRILTKRAEDEKALLLSRSQNSLDDEEMKRTINKDPVNINLRSK